MIHQAIKPGTVHDSFCRCRTCKPPLVGEVTLVRRARNFTAICLVALGIWLGVAISLLVAR